MAQTIVFDGCVLSKRFLGTGIHRYACSLLREFEKITAGEADLAFQILVPSVAEWELDGWTQRPGFDIAAQPLMRFNRAWMYGLVNSLTARIRTGTLFIPLPVAIHLKPRRLAVTIHDIIPLVFAEQYRSLRQRFFLDAYTLSMRKADLIFTDSQCSKADMVSRFRVPPEKIVVAYLGFDSDLFKPGPVNPSESQDILRQRGITKPYVLHVGRGDPRKNLVRLVRAYDLLIARRKDLDFQLVLSGPLGWGYEPLLQLLTKPTLQGRVILTGSVPDHELKVLHIRAACFAMPSLYEGFGLPSLEAMASGIPLMSSNRSSLPEIAGDAALYFDPESVEEMSVVMERLLTDSAIREQLAARGLEHAKQFSWEACARTTLAALKAL